MKRFFRMKHPHASPPYRPEQPPGATRPARTPFSGASGLVTRHPPPVTRQGMQKKHVRHSPPPPQNLNEINRLGTSPSRTGGEGVSGAGVAAWSRRAVRVRPLPAPPGHPYPRGLTTRQFCGSKGRSLLIPSWEGWPKAGVGFSGNAGMSEPTPPLRPSPRIPGLDETVGYSVPGGAEKHSPSFIRSAGFQPASRPGWPRSQEGSPSTFTRNQQSTTRCSSLVPVAGQRRQWLRQSCVQEAWHVLFHKPIP